MVDRSSIRSTVAAMYRAICHGPGQPPDWTVEREIFAPTAQLIRHSELGREVFTLDSYIRNVEAMIAEGRLPAFFEREISSVIHEYGHIGHSFSVYEARPAEQSAEILFRGINSVQLVRTEGLWQIVSLVWQRESPSLPIPGIYLSPEFGA